MQMLWLAFSQLPLRVLPSQSTLSQYPSYAPAQAHGLTASARARLDRHHGSWRLFDLFPQVRDLLTRYPKLDVGSSLTCVACNDVESHATRVSARRLTTT